MKLKLIVYDVYQFLKRRIFLLLWISLVLYIFYDTFNYYKYGQEFYYLRRILGLGLCISRGTATVLNLCAALILLPLCKKLNQILYAILSNIWPGLFFFWLEKAKSIHMTVAITLSLFAVIHSISHFVNLWNFSRGYDEERPEINFANYKNESPFVLLLSMAGWTGVSMLLIIISMSLTSMRFIRRKFYNAFWFNHQLYMLFIVLLVVHPLSGVLKKQINENDSSLNPSQIEWSNTTNVDPKFAPIESRAWLWMLLPLTCYFMDLTWRICTRNRARVEVLDATLLPGRTICLNLSCPHDGFVCRTGQYVLLQCLEASLIEWHPFTVVKVPTSYQRNFTLWIRVKGDWTEALENLLIEKGLNKISLFVDGPFSSPMEGASGCEIAICIAAGVGITPFVSLLHDMLLNPRKRTPGRVHLIWIVRNEQELLWLAELANKTIRELRNANRPDRLHLELYITSNKDGIDKEFTHTLIVDDKGELTHVLNKDENKKANLQIPKNATIISNLDKSHYNLQHFDDNDEMTSLFTPTLQGNNTKIKVDTEREAILTPNLNRNISRFRYADDANERDSLLTPTLKRNNSKAKNSNPNKVMYDFTNKIVNELSPVNHIIGNHNNLEANLLRRQVATAIYRKNNENQHGEIILKTNIDRHQVTAKNINNVKNISNTSVILPILKYEDNGPFYENKMNNDVHYDNYIENIKIDTISKHNWVPFKVLNKGTIENNLQMNNDYKKFNISKEYPLLSCRVRRGRPHWDRVFGYWVHLYPSDHLNLYCCGPKKLVKLLKKKCKEYSRDTKTTFAFVHEGFS